MKDLYVVTEIQDDKIIVSPCVQDGCPESEIPHISVINPKHYKIQVGSFVTINFYKRFQGRKGFLALFTPVIGSLWGYYASYKISLCFNIEYRENIRFICTLFSFLVIYLFIVLISRKSPMVVKPRITSLIKNK